MEGQLKKITTNSNSNNNSNGNNHDMQNNNEISEQNLMKQFIEFNQNYQQHQQNIKNGNINHNPTATTTTSTTRHQNNKNSSSNSNISQKILDDWLENCIREQNYPFIQSNHLNGNSNNNSSNNNNNSNNYDNNLQSIKMNKKYSTDVTSSSIRNHQPNHYQNHQQNHITHHHPSSSSQQNLLAVDYFCNGIGPNHLDKYRKNFHLTETSINQEFMSLPPGINLIQYNNSNGSNNNNNHNNIDGCNSPKNSTITDGSNINNNNSRNNNNNNNNINYNSDLLINEFEKSRRYSDPGLGGIVINFDEDDSKSSDNDNLDKKFNSSAAATISGANNNEANTKMLTLLLEQIHMLHETNTKICRNLQETKVEVEALKNAPPSWPYRHRKDSISGFSSHSQPLNFNMGNQSPMPTYQSGMYTPGLLTDVVREVREAARVREEALINRVRSLVDERQWASNDNRLKMMKDVEDLKVQVLQLRTDKKDLHHQILQMETEIKSLKSFLTFVLAQTNNRPPQHGFSSSGGIIYPTHHIPPHSHHVEPVEQAYQIEENCNDFPESVKRFANMNISNGDGGGGGGDDVFQNLNDSGGSGNSNNGFKTNKTMFGSPDGQIIHLERDNIQLRRELQNARTATNNSEHRIKKLENMVAMMQTKLKPDEQITETSQPQTVTTKSTSGTTNKISLSKILEFPKVSNNKNRELQMGIQVQDVTPYEVHINHSGPVTDL